MKKHRMYWISVACQTVVGAMLVAPKLETRVSAYGFGFEYAFRLLVGVFIMTAVFVMPGVVVFDAVRSRNRSSVVFATMVVIFSVILVLALLLEIS